MQRQGDGVAQMLRRRFDWLQSFTDDELRRISICEQGDSLAEGEQYFDLSNPERGVIGGRPGEQVPEGSCFVARGDVDTETWRKLTTTFTGGTQLRM